MLLSVLMPSNRPLERSRRSIETALAFCEKRDALLIVSDNSRDPAKAKLLRKASRRLRYIVPEADGIEANLRNLYDSADTEFILMMGDDDELFVSPKDSPVPLESLDDSFIGLRPLVAVANSEGRVVRIKDFGIMDERPGARIMTYNTHAKGDNAAYYSIYRRKPFIDLHRFFFDHHPLKLGLCDWPLACVLFSYGKLAYDAGTVYKYNNHKWDSQGKIDGQVQAMYQSAGLPASSDRFALLLLYLDIVIMALRAGSPLDAEAKRDLVDDAGRQIIQGLCRKVTEDAAGYGETMLAFANAIMSESHADRQFEIALRMADCILPGLTQRYRAFHAASKSA